MNDPENVNLPIPQSRSTDGLGCRLKTPSKLNDVAIFIAGLAEMLQARLDECQHGDVIHDANHLYWSYQALAEMANDLAEQIGQYAP